MKKDRDVKERDVSGLQEGGEENFGEDQATEVKHAGKFRNRRMSQRWRYRTSLTWLHRVRQHSAASLRPEGLAPGRLLTCCGSDHLWKSR